MKRFNISIFVFLILLITSVAQGEGFEITRTSGGSIQTNLNFGIVVNKDSSLEREWIAVNDSALPVEFADESVGLTTIYSDSDRGYRYRATFDITIKEAVSAIEIRFITFDIWGEHVHNFVTTQIADFEPGEQRINTTWRALSENEVSKFYASIAYIARVRTVTGQVLEMDSEQVVMEAQRFSESFAGSDLDLDDQGSAHYIHTVHEGLSQLECLLLPNAPEALCWAGIN